MPRSAWPPGGEILKSDSVSFIGAADVVPQAGQPAPPNAQMRALNSYFYFYFYSTSTSTSTLLSFFSGSLNWREPPNKSFVRTFIEFKVQ